MTPKEAFKVGFMHKCAADGLTPEQTMERIRHAKFMMKAAQTPILSDLVSAGGTAMKWGIPLALLAPPVAGLGAGYTLAKMRDETFDKDEAMKKEEIAEYQRAVEKLRRLRDRQMRGM